MIGQVGLHFGSEDPLAPVARAPWYHRSLTEAAATAQGWAPAAAVELGWHAAGVDLYLYHPFFIAGGGPRRWRAARAARAALEKVHFDDLASTAQIEEVWHRITGGTLVGLRLAAEQRDVGLARQVIGVGLHAIQDFYSHSTWLDAPQRRDSTWLAGWSRFALDRDAPPAPAPELGAPAADLSTGGFAGQATPHPHGRTRLTAGAALRVPLLLLGSLVPPTVVGKGAAQEGRRLPRGVCPSGPPGINLDSRWQAPVGARTRALTDLDGDAAFALAIGLAGRESRTWLRILDELNGDDAFWQRVRAEPAGRRTRPFEAQLLRAHEFLAAGEYPPVGTPSATAWFVRVVAGERGGRRVLVEFRSGAGATLDRFEVRRGTAAVAGPLPAGATHLAPGPGELHAVQAFRRAPEAELRRLEPDSGAGGWTLPAD